MLILLYGLEDNRLDGRPGHGLGTHQDVSPEDCRRFDILHTCQDDNLDGRQSDCPDSSQDDRLDGPQVACLESGGQPDDHRKAEAVQGISEVFQYR